MSHSDSNESLPRFPQGELLAYYQPIIALETRSVVGYESLGRQVIDGTVRSLGPFFTDARIPVQEHVRVDRLLREQSFAKLNGLAHPPTLFLNLKPSWIYEQFKQTGELHTLHLLRKYDIPANRICIEITEEEFKGSMSELNEIMNLYRECGCQIAIDDIGTGFSNFDRIAQIQPNLLKVDVHLMKKSASHKGYLGALRSFSTLAEQIGASLLIEGVESSQDLKRAIEIGARYVQGYLFSPAERDFHPKDAFTSLIEAELREHRFRLRESMEHWDEVGRRMIATVFERDIRDEFDQFMNPFPGARIDADLMSCEQADRVDRAIARILPRLDDSCLRVYLCDNNGIQLSSNHIRTEDGHWRVEEEYRNADWSWRPYFVPHLSHGESRIEAKLSLRYSDLDSHAWIRTASVPIGSSLLLLMDIEDNQD
ncbi:EAL domain-containing protein [Cohnella endophytica]|uniref:EAL domain-containing protein n=1 Tax=Cohnella endophytica TaxID=2419778 RepID=A0A494XIL9_9BACL|nr:EAL domain-containing protein [Cohnella endophytica]